MQGFAGPARRGIVADQDARRDAVDRAYRDHADDVYRVAFAILRDTEPAVDATHDTFARAFERWHQYDSNRSLRAWLHGIVSQSYETADTCGEYDAGLIDQGAASDGAAYYAECWDVDSPIAVSALRRTAAS